jgi:hypothetical protein
VTDACSRLGWRAGVVMYAGYVAGVVCLTWPLATNPAGLWSGHHDAALFTWAMAGWARWLVHAPLSLADGNAFYPYSHSLAFSEHLLLPAVLGMPGLLAGRPVLAFNLLVLLYWPVNGLAMAWAAHQVTRSRTAAWLAGAVFCLSPYFAIYQKEFNVLPAAAVPLAIVAWVRWLERQEPRWLALAAAAVALQGLTGWYYTVMLGLGLAVLTVGFVALRWRGWCWRRQLAGLTTGGLAVGAVLLPVALPYVALNQELGFERTLDDADEHSTDLLAFLEPRQNRFFKLRLTRHRAETAPFVGYTVLVLAALGAAWLPGTGAPAGRAARLWWPVAVAGCLAGAALAGVLGPVRHRAGPLSLRLTPSTFLMLLLGLALVRLAGHGWAHWRGLGARALDRRDWVRLLTLLALVSALLALGPTIRVGGHALGDGPYTAFYRALPPLHAIRITTRFAVLTIAALALLAALGWRWLEAWPALTPRRRRLLLAGVVAAMALEYATHPHRYVPVTPARPVDQVLRADPDDVAVLEWPAFRAVPDSDAMFRSLHHGKRVVNGHSGFVPGFLEELARELERPGPAFPSAAAEAWLRGIFPLRYLVVRLADVHAAEQRGRWLALRDGRSPLLRFRGSYGADDLYEVVPLPERAAHVERRLSSGILRAHAAIELSVAPLEPGAAADASVAVRLNGRSLGRVPLDGPRRVRVPIVAGRLGAAPNVLALDGEGGPLPAPDDPRYRIGATGAVSPGELRVEGGEGSIRLDGREVSPSRRGYNLVALSPDGEVTRAANFDTFIDYRASRRLAAWVRALPAGTVVAGAVRYDASGQLTQRAVDALRQLGVTADLRNRFAAGHAFVGVKGAPPGTALEQAGPGTVRVAVGPPRVPRAFELSALALAR